MDASYQCPRCSTRKPTYEKLLKHQQIYHQNESGFSIVCGLENCPKEYFSVKSLQNHIRKKHRHQAPELEFNTDLDLTQEIVASTQTCDGTGLSLELYYIENFTETIKKQLALFSLNLQEKHVVNQKVQTFVVNEVESIFKHFINIYRDIFSKYLHTLNVDVSSLQLLNSEDNNLLEHCFSAVSSTYQLHKYCVENLNLIEPVEYILGVDPSTGKQDTFQYIPLLKVLNLICKDHNIVRQVFRPDTPVSDTLTDFNNGKIYQENPFFNTNEPRLRIQLYSDEFEVVNPLGSKKLLHKVSAFYFTVGNIPPKHRSALRHIHLLLLVKHRLVKSYGFEKILEPLICDLQRLQEGGLQLDFECRNYCIKGGLVTVSADNLTAHTLAGFSGSFSNGRICRFCMCHYKDLSTTISEENCVLRTDTTHAYHLKCVEDDPSCKSIYGVNGPCIFSKLSYFETTKAFPPDVMHDFLEGIVPLVLKSVLKALHKDKTLSIQVVNDSLRKFCYGQNDCTSKPVLIPEKVALNGNISGTAVEKWTLFRTLPFLIGPKIEKDNKFWQLYLVAREIGEIILAPIISTHWISHLHGLITLFLTDFNDLFPASFTPKLHFLVHYPRLILEYGAPRSYWCMRYEAKHQYFKKVARITNNYVNICQTLAKRHQLSQCWEWQPESPIKDYHSQASVSELAPEELPVNLQACLLNLETPIAVDEKLWKSKCIVLNSIKYAIGDFFILDLVHAEQIPLFVKITLIVHIRANWILVGKLFTTTAFSRHFHSYNVRETDELLMFKAGEEVDFHALDAYRCDGKELITLIHRPLKDLPDLRQ